MGHVGEHDHAHLLTRIAVRDRGAFATLYKQTSPSLYRIVGRVLGRSDLAGEVIQEVYLRIWEKAGLFDPLKGSPLAWMATIARNLALDEITRKTPVAFGDLPEDFEPADENFDPLDALARREHLAALLRALSAMGTEKRQMVLLAYYCGASRKALSKRFNRPVATIKTLLHRSLVELKSGLSA